ncbi:MAG: hypothetical protein R3189_06870 [Thiomicrorhabdus chilensis]|uniref:hypothetical protein n=1 Tax=Thiomicrorhabdus chilensis TaxID=63656 RepID=UPI00299DB995|nr:hypothetical protein [Thiomicrorhabdus chilensis]MDX1347953.1 hypothetical protein [Thiomicrorhabdus chilensis]
MKIWYPLFIIMVSALGFYSFNSESNSSLIRQDDVVTTFAIEHLVNEIYYFPSNKPGVSETEFQPLERFDLIFVGYDLNAKHVVENTLDLARSIPGVYTHMLAYIGKDADGFAYAVEMNSDKNKSFSIGVNGIEVGGRLYVYCLGSDYGSKECPQDNYIYGIESYDYMWAKRLKPELRIQLKHSEKQLIKTIKEDLLNAHPFQLQFDLSLETTVNKKIPIVDDGRQNGSDCTTYFISLFEEIASVCLDDIRMNAKAWEAYYLNDPIGQQAIIPKEYNPFNSENIYIMEMLKHSGYFAVDNQPRKTNCTDRREVHGITTPDLVFNSPSLVDIDPVGL